MSNDVIFQNLLYNKLLIDDASAASLQSQNFPYKKKNVITAIRLLIDSP